MSAKAVMVNLIAGEFCVYNVIHFFRGVIINSGDFTYLFLFVSIFIIGICILIYLHFCCITARFAYPHNTVVQLIITFLLKDIFLNLLLLFLFACGLDIVVYYSPSLFCTPGIYMVLCYMIEEQIFRKPIKNL